MAKRDNPDSMLYCYDKIKKNNFNNLFNYRAFDNQINIHSFRLLAQLVTELTRYGKMEEAYELAKPMMERVILNNGFFEWYKLDGSPAGSAEFKGSAGVLAKSIEMFYEWAYQNHEKVEK